MLRAIFVVAAHSKATKLASRTIQPNLTACVSQFHQTCVLYKKRKKLDNNFVSRVMSDSPKVTHPDCSSTTKKDVEVVTLDGEDSSDDIQLVEEVVRPTEEMMANRLSGKAIYHQNCPLSRRCLDYTKFGEKISSQGLEKGNVQFSVMSYNVLAQELLESHPYLYQYNNPKCLAWQSRFSGIVREISFLKPDILCLQEVQDSHLDRYFVAALKNMGYIGTFKKRTGNKCDGCAVFWQKSKIDKLEQTSVEFYQPGVSLLDRDNIALVLRFSIEGQQIIVATTHLLYNPRRNDIRLAQVQLLLAELDRLSHYKVDGQTKHSPVIITGDFNLDPFTSVYKLITTGQLKYDSLTKPRLLHRGGRSSPPLGNTLVPVYLGVTDCCRHSSIVESRNECTESSERNEEIVSRELDLLYLHHSERKSNRRNSDPSENREHRFGSGTLTHNLYLTSAYLHRRHGQIEATTHQDEWTTVDYIFYSQMPPELGLKKLSLLSTWSLPTVNACRELGPIPNFDAPSDHLPLFANFMLS